MKWGGIDGEAMMFYSGSFRNQEMGLTSKKATRGEEPPLFPPTSLFRSAGLLACLSSVEINSTINGKALYTVTSRNTSCQLRFQFESSGCVRGREGTAGCHSFCVLCFYCSLFSALHYIVVLGTER